MSGWTLEDPVQLALAWALTDRDLTTPGWTPLDAQRSETDRITGLLEWVYPKYEHQLARDAAFEASRLCDGKRGTALSRIAHSVCVIEHGHPVLRDPVRSASLGWLLDIDLLAVVVYRDYLETCDRDITREALTPWGATSLLSWPWPVRHRASAFDPLLRTPGADTHVHLGGFSHATTTWLLELCERGVRAPWGPDEQLWHTKLDAARRALIPSLSSDPSTPVAGSDVAAALEAACVTEQADPAAAWPDDRRTLEGSLVLGDVVPLRAIVLRRLLEHPEALDAYVGVACSWFTGHGAAPGRVGLRPFREAMGRHRRVWPEPLNAPALSGLVARSLDTYLLGRDETTEIRVDFRVDLPREGQEIALGVRSLLRGVQQLLALRPQARLRVGFVLQLHRTSVAPEEDARVLARWLADNPRLRPFFVAVDAVGTEVDHPPRAFVDAWRVLRQVQSQMPRRLGDHSAPLRLAFHVGEEFRDLLTGIRHCHEVATHLGMGHGDRIGHGLALAWDPAVYYSSRRGVFPRLREHALDLLWAVSLLSDGKATFELSRWARQLLEDLLRRFGVRLPGAAVDHASGLIGLPTTEQTLLDTLRIRDDCERLVPLPADRAAWNHLVAAAQERSREAVQRAGLVIELNPTSNFIVGGFSRLADLPYLRLGGVPSGAGSSSLAVTINTDDPGIFQTTLDAEYVRLGEAWVAAGHPEPMVLAWLTLARQTGFAHAFSATSFPPDQLADALARVLDE